MVARKCEKNQNETKEQIIRVGERDVKKRKDEKRREGWEEMKGL